jgi:hypothetical protein
MTNRQWRPPQHYYVVATAPFCPGSSPRSRRPTARQRGAKRASGTRTRAGRAPPIPARPLVLFFRWLVRGCLRFRRSHLLSKAGRACRPRSTRPKPRTPRSCAPGTPARSGKYGCRCRRRSSCPWGTNPNDTRRTGPRERLRSGRDRTGDRGGWMMMMMTLVTTTMTPWLCPRRGGTGTPSDHHHPRGGFLRRRPRCPPPASGAAERAPRTTGPRSASRTPGTAGRDLLGLRSSSSPPNCHHHRLLPPPSSRRSPSLVRGSVVIVVPFFAPSSSSSVGGRGAGREGPPV